jgi:hypothetical protein
VVQRPAQRQPRRAAQVLGSGAAARELAVSGARRRSPRSPRSALSGAEPPAPVPELASARARRARARAPAPAPAPAPARSPSPSPSPSPSAPAPRPPCCVPRRRSRQPPAASAEASAGYVMRAGRQATCAQKPRNPTSAKAKEHRKQRRGAN